MAEHLVKTDEMASELPSRRERHQSTNRKRKKEKIRPSNMESESIQETPSPMSEGEEEGPVRSKIFKKERERQGSLFVASSIFWLFILLVGTLLFFTIRHYS